MKCLRCTNEFEPLDDKTNICGNCADELRSEADAIACQAQADAEAEAFAKWEYEQAQEGRQQC